MISVAYIARETWRAYLLYYREEDRWYLTGQGDPDTEFAEQGDPEGWGMFPVSKTHARRLLHCTGHDDLVEQYAQALDPTTGDHDR